MIQFNYTYIISSNVEKYRFIVVDHNVTSDIILELILTYLLSLKLAAL